jgi:DNA (cytosine-5)-methyltransferase 1
MKKMRVGTDFSGIGSPEMALNLLEIEHEIEFACEIDKYARKSYEAMYGKPKKFYEDITKRDHSEVPQLDLYVAGFPCQAFSMAGSRKGFEDTRGTLFFNVAEFIKENQPKCFILENVKGLLSHDNGKTFDTIKAVLSDNGGTINGQASLPFYDDGLGYHIYYNVLNTKDYGIPQNRERIFIVGFKEYREFRFPKPFKLELRLKDMLQDNAEYKYYLSRERIETLNKNPRSIGFTNTDHKKTANCLIAGYGKQPTDGEYIINATYRHSFEGFKGYDNLSPTIKASEGSGNQILINNIRRLTPLECWRLQAYPNEAFYKAKEVNSDTQLYKQAGNSISVNVMKLIIEKIIKN